jgi:folate-binding protein YgfZ
MSKAFYVELHHRGLIHVEGEDRKAFLQGLISNDMEKLQPGQLLYACLLTPQGKFLHDFFIHEGDGFLLLDCEGGARAQDLYARLSKFKLRAKVKLSVEDTISVFAVFHDEVGLLDPRHADMGRRTFERPADMEERSFDYWDRTRIKLCIPDGSRDLEIEKSTLDEGRIDQLNGVAWDKGCYMGQELTARMHYRGLGKKHIRTVKIIGPTPAPFSDLPNGAQMRSSCGDHGIALFKDDDDTKVIE